MNALKSVQPYDWAKFLRARLDGHGPGAPLDGIARGGYKLVYAETPTDYFKDSEARRKVTDLTYSLGIVIGSDGRLTDVLWEGPGYKSGLTVGTQIIAVDGTILRCRSPQGRHQERQELQRRHRISGQERRSLPHRAHRLPRRTALPALGTRRERASAPGPDSDTA